MSYLGREEFSPAATRQQVLHERYGFLCSCERCQAEGRVDEKLQQLLAHTHDKLLKVRQAPILCEHALHGQLLQVLLCWSKCHIMCCVHMLLIRNCVMCMWHASGVTTSLRGSCECL